MKEELIKSYINKLKKEDIDHVILVGGSTRIPMVQELVKKELGKEPNRSVNPDDNIKNVDLDFISKYERYFNKDLYFKIIEKYNKYKSLLE